jgi:DNA-binding CsgD family transcriptional regulator
MSFWDRLLHILGLRPDPDPGPRTFDYSITPSLHESLLQLSTQQERPLDKITTDLLATGLHKYHQERAALLAWERLTLAEQDAVALACLGYSYKETSSRLHKPVSTITKWLRRSYIKLGVQNRVQLHLLFLDWDFSAWGPAAED